MNARTDNRHFIARIDATHAEVYTRDDGQFEVHNPSGVTVWSTLRMAMAYARKQQ